MGLLETQIMYARTEFKWCFQDVALPIAGCSLTSQHEKQVLFLHIGANSLEQRIQTDIKVMDVSPS